MQKGDLEQAEAKLRRALELRPDSVDAKRDLEALLQTQPGGAEVRGAEAGGAEAGGADQPPPKLRQSAEASAKAEAPPPQQQQDPARTGMAELEGYIRDGRYVEVEPLLEAYVKEQPSSSWGWYALGYSRFGQKKIGEAIKALAKSLELDVRNAEAHKILGRSLMMIGRFDAAQIEFEQGIRYKPDSAEMHYNLGKLLSIQDNWEPARKAFEAAIRVDPSYVEAVDALGLALEALGDDVGAVAAYKKRSRSTTSGRAGSMARAST